MIFVLNDIDNYSWQVAVNGVKYSNTERAENYSRQVSVNGVFALVN